MFGLRRRRHAVPGLVLVLAVGIAACSGDGNGEREDANAVLQRGLRAHAGGDLEAAEAAYLEVIALDPQNKFAYYNLAVIEQSRGELVQAEGNYRTTLTLDPDFVPALFNLAILRAEAGSADEAMELYEHVIDVTPVETASAETVRLLAAAHLNLGFLLIEQGFEGRGERELAKAVALDPSLEGRIEPETSGDDPVAQTSSETPTADT